MKTIRNKILQLMAIAMFCLSLLFAVAPSALAANTCTPNKPTFIGMPPWNEFLGGEVIGGHCAPTVNWPGGVWNIALAATDILLHVAGIAAVISLLVSSVMYVTSAGSPDRTKGALDRIISSLVGLAIAGVAAATVKFIGDRLSGNAPTTVYYNLPKVGGSSSLHTGLNIFFGLIGVIAFLMAVIGGFNYVLSQGNPDKTARARNTLIYAGVGLAVAALAASIVSVVLSKA